MLISEPPTAPPAASWATALSQIAALRAAGYDLVCVERADELARLQRGAEIVVVSLGPRTSAAPAQYSKPQRRSTAWSPHERHADE